MTAEEFIAWAMERPRGERHELVAGEVVAMAPERSAHALTKGQVFRRLAEAVEAARLPCTAYPDGMAVEIDAATIYEPDALVRCGPPLPDDAIKVTDPVIVVEVVSPSTRARLRRQTGGLFPASVGAALPDRQDGKPHRDPPQAGRGRGDRDAIIRDGTITLDPPGIVVNALFAAGS